MAMVVGVYRTLVLVSHGLDMVSPPFITGPSMVVDVDRPPVLQYVLVSQDNLSKCQSSK